ncbi:MAG: sugar phosphate isomerase/epimerase family protein [Planctomycetaceae bacterium]
MIRSPLGLRLNPARPIRDQIREAARLGAKGVVMDATGDLAPDRLSETGRRELRHLLRSVELALIALHLPTRRPFDTTDQLDDRLRRADAAFALAYGLGTSLVLARVGAAPPESEADRREVWTGAVRELGRRADHRGLRLAIETGTEPGPVLRAVLDALGTNGLAASLDPASLLARGLDPVATARDLGPWVAHAYANDATAAAPRIALANPRGLGFPPGTLDWEEYLGALEEITYRGFLTIWPDPSRDPGPQFTALADRLARF